MITLTGGTLTAAQLVAYADHGEPVEVEPTARARAGESRRTLLDVLARRPVYGRTTGVGANHSVPVTPGAGQRLLHSHTGGAGPMVVAREARATLVVRANQLLAGGSGVNPALVDALVAAANSGAVPALPSFGSIGTGDLSALAALALTLQGERPWIGSGPPGPAPYAIDELDALALLSSSALTIAQAALAYSELVRLADSATVVAALTLTALDGSSEPFAAVVAGARPHPGSVAVATRMRVLLDGRSRAGARIQDPYGLRALAPVQGVLVDSLDRLGQVLTIELNAAAENPLVSTNRSGSTGAGDVFHHGNFHQAPLAAALDATRLALLASAQLGVTRLGSLLEPRLTGLTPFLADGPSGSSGLMIVEYTAASALAALRAAATPVTGGGAVLSRGAEEHASFAPQGVRQMSVAIEAYRLVVAAELLAAVRALRLRPAEPLGPQLQAVFERAAATLPADAGDRSLDGDLALAAGLLDEIGGPA